MHPPDDHTQHLTSARDSQAGHPLLAGEHDADAEQLLIRLAAAALQPDAPAPAIIDGHPGGEAIIPIGQP